MKPYLNNLKTALCVVLFVCGCLALGILIYFYAEVLILFIGIIPMAIAFFGQALNNGGKTN